MLIDLDSAKAMLDSAVALKGADYVYTRPEGQMFCSYVHVDENGNRSMGCLIGTALILAGVLSLDDFAPDQCAGDTGFPLNGTDANALVSQLRRYGHTVSEDAEYLFSAAQGAQDCGTPWGTAVANAYTDVSHM